MASQLNRASLAATATTGGVGTATPPASQTISSSAPTHHHHQLKQTVALPDDQIDSDCTNGTGAIRIATATANCRHHRRPQLAISSTSHTKCLVRRSNCVTSSPSQEQDRDPQQRLLRSSANSQNTRALPITRNSVHQSIRLPRKSFLSRSSQFDPSSKQPVGASNQRKSSPQVAGNQLASITTTSASPGSLSSTQTSLLLVGSSGRNISTTKRPPATLAATNSRLRQGALYARRQYNINTPAASLTSRVSPLTPPAITSYASLSLSSSNRLNLRSSSQSLLQNTTRRQFNISSNSIINYRQSPIVKTSSRFSLTSSTSSLVSLAAVKRTKQSPPQLSNTRDNLGLGARSSPVALGTAHTRFSVGRPQSGNSFGSLIVVPACSKRAAASTAGNNKSAVYLLAGAYNRSSISNTLTNQKPTTRASGGARADYCAFVNTATSNDDQTNKSGTTSTITTNNNNLLVRPLNEKSNFVSNKSDLHQRSSNKTLSTTTKLSSFILNNNLPSRNSESELRDPKLTEIIFIQQQQQQQSDSSLGNTDPMVAKDKIAVGRVVLDVAIRTEPICDYYDLEARPFARGKFAQVKRCINKTSKQCFAAKCIKKRRRLVDIRHEILLEIEALKLSYYTDRIVKLYEVFETSNEMILVLEMANGGELQRVLDDEESIDERIVRRMVNQILEGLVELHDNDIAHLDIKPQNLLLTEAYPNGNVKLCDFGISRRITKECEIREICGTPDYVAPEILRYDPISLATDMWSLGVLTYVLLSGYSPFGSENKQQTFCNITQATLDFPSEIFDKISKTAIDFMQKLIVRDPLERLTSRQARNHPWLSQCK